MENNVEKALSNFVDEPVVEEVQTKDDQVKKVVLGKRRLN